MKTLRLVLLVCLGIGLLSACSGSPAAQSTSRPPAAGSPAAPGQSAPAAAQPGSPAHPPLTYADLKDLQLCKLAIGCVTFKDGRNSDNGASAVMLETPIASGDLNNDGWPDAAVAVQESYSGSANTDMVVLLNQQGKPVELAGTLLGNGDLQVQALQIENGQVIAKTIPAAPVAADPHYATAGATATYKLLEDSLAQVQLTTDAKDGTHREIQAAPVTGSVTSSPYVVTLRLSAAPYNDQMTFNIYDATGASLYEGSSPVTQSGQNEYQLPIDLSWVKAGPLQIVVRDFYSAQDSAMDLAFNTLAFDYQPPARTVLPPMFVPGSFRMLDASHGWAQSAASGQLLRTTNGGQTWLASPLAITGTLSLSTLDSATAWAKMFPSNPTSPEAPATLYHTIDGGQTWTPLTVVPTVIDNSILSFLDPQVGFLENHPEGYYMMGQTVFQLYRTLDGGQTWEKTFDNTSTGDQKDQEPGRGHMVFRDRDNGWALDNVTGMVIPDSLFLMRSRDGGRTWQNQALPKPQAPANSNLSLQSLTFFGPKMAIMPLVIVPPSGGTTLRLYLSPDGGETWKLTQPLTIHTSSPHISPLSTTTVLVQDSDGKLYRTEDGGMTWVEQPFHAPAPGDLVGLQFITPQVGFALVNDHNPDAYNTGLYVTSDGGATWRSIEPQLP